MQRAAQAVSHNCGKPDSDRDFIQKSPGSGNRRGIETLGELIQGVSERREVLGARIGSLA